MRIATACATGFLLWAVVAQPVTAQHTDLGTERGAAGAPPVALPAIPPGTSHAIHPGTGTMPGQGAGTTETPPPASPTDPAWGLDDRRLPTLWPDAGLRSRVQEAIHAAACPLTPEAAPRLWSTLGLTPAEGLLVIRRMESAGEVVVSPDRRAVFPAEGCR